MGFWGIEVKPGKPQPYHSDNVEGTLFVTQATLGLGKSTDRSILQCSVGHKSPIFLCSLLPEKTESCPLKLEFKDELVAFSVVGKRSIHLSGYFVADEGDYRLDEYESDSGEDIADTESDDETSEFEYDDEDGDEFINDGDDDFNVFRSSPVPNSGVVIEEIEDDEQPANGDGLSKLKKKKNDSGGVSVMESEDEDGFPVSAAGEGGKAIIQYPESKKNKRKVKATTEPDSQPEKKKKKKQKQKGVQETVADMIEDDKKELSGDEALPADAKEVSPDTREGDKRETEVDEGSAASKSASKKNKEKKNKEKKKNKKAGEESTVGKPVAGVTSDGGSDEKQSASKSSSVRTFPNGLVIEDLDIGKPNAKRASPGSQVSVCYTGKLQKNGKIFDSNVGRAPFKFRLGVGQVIKGWDVGVNGMRVGDKRRLTIPPAMGYGHQGAGNKIPPNSWLVFDVELKDVR
ncbi:unnamed protein product [Linum tenue]|uniref:FK506-binding protein n=1 Tax=Linum tenue TaxID=586396 RepID=A0AAV0QPZ1_9ROSI|nr:unnamed protein product [Linum tenue]